MEILCFFAGAAFLLTKSVYPVGLPVLCLWFRPHLKWGICFLLGILWSGVHQYVVMPRDFPEEAVLSRVMLEGVVASIPIVRADGSVQFQFLADRLETKPVRGLIALSCYDHCPSFQAGERWQLLAKIKQPQNLGNFGGFDYVSSLKARHVHWVGYTRSGHFKRLSNQHTMLHMTQFREKLATHLKAINPDVTTLGILQALTLGVTNHIDADTWGLFRRTGTTHLMVISGAHIGLVAGLMFSCCQWIWSRLHRASLFIPAPRVGALCGLLAAFGYAVLAGWGVSTQRALIACLVMLSRYFLTYRFSVWQAWRYALLGVVLFDPHAVMLPGFYLSFLAVAILVALNQRVLISGFRKTMLLQVGCLLGLMPLTLFWFSYGSFNGFFANLIAIPWVSFVIIPLSLLITVLSDWVSMSWVVTLNMMAIKGLLLYLSWIDSFSMVNLSFVLSPFLNVLALMVAMMVMIFLPLRSMFPCALLLMIMACFPSLDRISKGEAWVDVLDVGQGLSLVVRTKKHVLVYDTGMKFYRGNDMGNLALVPYLKAKHVRQVDTVVISHPDLDHRGGLSSLTKEYPSYTLLVDDPTSYQNARSCHDYPSWTWDGVSFQFFPIYAPFKEKNNRSCVLKVTTSGGQFLLTGDIERTAETYLVRTYGEQLASSVMLVPHHASKTSSSVLFIEQVRPNDAIASYGFDNRYHFPHQSTLKTYQARHIPVHATQTCGMVQVLLSRNTSRVTCSFYHKA